MGEDAGDTPRRHRGLWVVRIAARLYEGIDGDRRDDERLSAERIGTIRVEDDGAGREVIVSDLTRYGCRFEHDGAIARGTQVTIGLAGIGMREAQVSWSRGGVHGCEFDLPLSPGGVTAATVGNVRAFPDRGVDNAGTARPVKWSPVARVMFLGGAVIASWAALIGVGTLLLA